MDSNNILFLHELCFQEEYRLSYMDKWQFVYTCIQLYVLNFLVNCFFEFYSRYTPVYRFNLCIHLQGGIHLTDNAVDHGAAQA